MAKFKLAIVGAGPAGCTLARLLLHKNVDVDITIFEAEEQIDARTQGDTLDLHPESGQQALKECGLYEDFVKLARYDGEAFRVTNQHLQSYLLMGGTKDAKTSRGRPEIDRIQLRYLLLESIDPTLIHWNHKVDSVVELDGKYRLDFRGGQESQTGFDLIVGSDGCWSKVRKRITDELPYYSGVSGVSFKISDPQKRCLDMYELVNRGSLFAFGDHKAVTSQQINDGGCLSVSYWTLAPDDWIDKFKDKTSTDVDFHKQACLEELDGWDPRLRKLLEVADSHAISRQLFMLPVGITWTNKPGLTLLGDAAHVMTPFAGEGVNLAMSDAMNLVTAIENAVTIGTHDALYAEVAAYENDMFVRATKVQQQTYDMMSASLLDEGGVDKNIEKYIMAAVGDQLPTYVRPIAGFMTRCIYGVLRWWRPPRS